MASVFVYGADNLSTPGNTANAVHRKNSKFATAIGDTNYPRTAAFAQVGSLPLIGREFTLSINIAEGAEELVAGGPPKTYRASLEPVDNSTLAGDTIVVALSGDGLAFSPAQLTFNSLSAAQDLDVRALQTANQNSRIIARLVGRPASGQPTSVSSSPTRALNITRNFIVTFEESAEKSLVIGRGSPENDVEIGLLGDTTALLTENEELVVNLTLNPAIPGVTVPSQVTLRAGAGRSTPATIVVAGTTAKNQTGNLELTFGSFTNAPTLGSGDVTLGTALPVRTVDEIQVVVQFRHISRGENDAIILGDVIDMAAPLVLLKNGIDVEVGAYLDAAALEGTTNLPEVNVRLTAPEDSGIAIGGSITLGPGHVADSPRAFKINAEAGAPTDAGVEVTTTNEPVQESAFQRQIPPRRFVESSLYINVVPNLALDSGQEFAGSGAVIKTIGDDDYILVPGPGPLTGLNLAEVAADSDEDIYACVRKVTLGADGSLQPVNTNECTEAATDDDSPGKYRLVMSNASTARAVWEVGPYLHEIKWAGFEGDDTANPIEIPAQQIQAQPSRVYVAPMVGFDTAVQRYPAGVAAGVELSVASGGSPAGLSGQMIHFTISTADATIRQSITVSGVTNGAVAPALSAETFPDGREVRVSTIGSTAFSSGGYEGPDPTMLQLQNNELFSIGNASLTLLRYTPRTGVPTITDNADAALPLFVLDSATFPTIKVSSDFDLEIYAGVQALDAGTATFTIVTTPRVTRAAADGPAHTIAPDVLGIPSLTDVNFVHVFVESTAADVSYQVPVVDADPGFTAGEPEPGAYALTQPNPDSNNLTLLTTDFGRIGAPQEVDSFSDIVGGVHDYVVPGLTRGQIVSVVLMLVDGDYSVASLAPYKFTEEMGWELFMEGDVAPDDAVYSASAPCPAASASKEIEDGVGTPAWSLVSNRSGVSDGNHRCLLVQIADGSMNDADGLENGVVFDPIALGPGGGRPPSSGGGGAIEPLWLVLLASGLLLSVVGLRRRKARASVLKQK